MNFTNAQVKLIIPPAKGGHMNSLMKTLLLYTLISIQAQADIVETSNLESCLTLAESNTRGTETQDVLYVFDIDNTALELRQNLGSVQWFRWQRSLIEQNEIENRVAADVDELLMKQGWIYQLAGTRTPEGSTSLELSQLQQKGHPVIFHTSRNTDTRGPTERELRLNSLLPLKKSIEAAFPGEFKFDGGPENQRPVSFQKGVYMSAGQNKGTWLWLLLKKVGANPKAIVFVDDERKNLENVEKALETKVNLTLCRYGKSDDIVKKFNESNKDMEINLWNKLAEVVGKLH